MIDDSNLDFEQERSRREFLKFMGRSSAGLIALAAPMSLISACATVGRERGNRPGLVERELGFLPIAPSSADDLILANGFKSQILISEGDLIAPGLKFGAGSDYCALMSGQGKLNSNQRILWNNHESMTQVFDPDFDSQRASVGGSLCLIEWNGSRWNWIPNSPYNRRLDADTVIPFSGQKKIRGSHSARGTLANCAGGVTPWGTVLTCEENYHFFWGEREHRAVSVDFKPSKRLKWTDHESRPPEHYGWVVEVEPLTGKSVKQIALGRFAHEGATVGVAHDGRPVVYMGDDTDNQFLYKFVGDRPGSLESGTLYVAKIEEGRWIPLDRDQIPELKAEFETQLDVMIYARKAARMMGATPLDRPEDIEIDPKSGAIYVALTNNQSRGNLTGSILKLEEKGSDLLATHFKTSTFLTGGPSSGVACPDNLAFDSRGNLWVSVDMSASVMGKGSYASFKNNGLFYVPMSGPLAGQAFQVASAPVDAELTGIWFDEKTVSLFLSVQHPGEATLPQGTLTSQWNLGERGTPRSAVVTISGPALTRILSV
jgi:secreted PhoX family phosphatase